MGIRLVITETQPGRQEIPTVGGVFIWGRRFTAGGVNSTPCCVICGATEFGTRAGGQIAINYSTTRCRKALPQHGIEEVENNKQPVFIDFF